MPSQFGNDIRLYAGETLVITVNVLDSMGLPETDISTAKFAVQKVGESEPVISDCTIVESEVLAQMSQAETLEMLGTYDYEIRIRAGVDVDTIVTGKIKIIPGLFTVEI